ncbi:DUF1294 domain-containing protein [uncultured Brevundimonas sp.]|uniref:DUF1294 domain-containing protein n=1 Tax=uncultured Brevundimonas sp. TaxID=213418 RepID=UPI0030EC769A|tara:strand:- start:2166 stop:2456 length:291 start_codon:yes stop_codon:yes gene_type:complete
MTFPPVIALALSGLTVTSLGSFGLFWFDKVRARNHGRRVPERTLLWAALFGGTGAWLGQQLLRHKTRKQPFRSWLGLVLILHGLLVAAGLVVLVLR